MKTIERYQWRHSIVFIFNSEHILSFSVIAEFEQVTFPEFMLKKQTHLKTRWGISCASF